MIFRAKAPLRISFAGGGTDIEPFASEQGGAVINTTINKYAYTTIKPRKDNIISIKSLDFNTEIEFNIDEKMVYDGNLDLLKAAIKRLGFNNLRTGYNCFVKCDAPPGSGLGSSASVVISLIGALCKMNKIDLSKNEIAMMAYDIERIDLDYPGGKQDQYASTYGGFNYIEFKKSGQTVINSLQIEENISNELNSNLLLCYLKKSRISEGIIDSQINSYQNRDVRVIDAMNKLKLIALEVKNSLLEGKLNQFGELLNVAWKYKKLTSKNITNSEINNIYDLAIKNGSLGGKISGAGGGGFMYFYCPFDKKHNVANALKNIGVKLVEFKFELNGLQTWIYE
jgi:D-glycero-alpha-D-manno-heptose-7-phosphate kinase